MMNESNMKLDLISRQDAIDALERKKDKNAKGDIGGFYNKIIQNDIDALMQLPSAEQDVPDTNVGDIISRQAAIYVASGYCHPANIAKELAKLPSAQPTIYGYNVEHLEMIARVLQKENLPPERVVEILTDIGRIVAIVRDEFEETLRKAVEQCMT